MPDGQSMLFSIVQGGRAAPSVSVSLPVTRGEMGVLKALAVFLIPRLLGFDTALEMATGGAGGGAGGAASPPF